jgi:hypothetical protein
MRTKEFTAATISRAGWERKVPAGEDAVDVSADGPTRFAGLGAVGRGGTALVLRGATDIECPARCGKVKIMTSTPSPSLEDLRARVEHLEWALETTASNMDMIVAEIDQGARSSLNHVRIDLASYAYSARAWLEGRSS